MTLPRRTLLTRAAAALAALSAPALALLAGRKRPKYRAASFTSKPFDLEKPCLPLGPYRVDFANDIESSLREARGLLAQAREMLNRSVLAPNSVPRWREADTERCEERLGFIARLDAALGRGAGREG